MTHAIFGAFSRFTLLGLLGLVCSANAVQVAQKKIQFDGYNDFISESGVGRPAVVFVSGLGEDTATWQNVEPQVAQFTHTLVYDRAGLGKSDTSSKLKSIGEMVLELHLLLKSANIPTPCIFVGHSLGGAIVQLFAHLHPDEVAGMVLVDPEDGRLLDLLRARLTPDQWDQREQALNRVMPKLSDVQKAELDGVKASGKALANALPIPDVPVILLTGTKKDPGFPGNPLEQYLKLGLHNDLVAQIPHAKHVLVPESRHYIQDDAPTVVIQAIEDVVSDSRKTKR